MGFAADQALTPNTVNSSVERTREYLTVKEVEDLMAAARKSSRYGHRDATMILIAYRHGRRASEICDLQWHQVELNGGRLHVRRSKRGTPSVHPIQGDELRVLCVVYNVSSLPVRTADQSAVDPLAFRTVFSSTPISSAITRFDFSGLASTASRARTDFGLYSMPQLQVALVSEPHPTQIRREIAITCSVGALMPHHSYRQTIASSSPCVLVSRPRRRLLPATCPHERRFLQPRAKLRLQYILRRLAT